MNRRLFSLFPLGFLAACRAKPGPKPPPLPPPVVKPKVAPPTSSIRRGPHDDVLVTLNYGEPLTDAQVRQLCERLVQEMRRTGITL